MPISTTLVAQESISYAVLTDKANLIRLLKRNGVQMPDNASNNEVTVATLVASQKSPVFRKELASYLTSKVADAHSDFKSFAADSKDWGFTGLDDFQFTGNQNNFMSSFRSENGEDSGSSQDSGGTNPDGTKKKTKVGAALANIGQFLKDNVLTKENINAGIQLGLQSIANKNQQKANNLQAEAQNLQAQQNAMAQNLPADKVNKSAGMSTTTKVILITLGVAALVTTIIIISKKSK